MQVPIKTQSNQLPTYMQKIILMSVLLISITATAQQTKTDTAWLQYDSLYKHSGNAGYKQPMDTTGKSKIMQDYGMRIYDTRIGRYIPPEPKQNTAPNTYAYTNKEPVKKKPGKKQPQ